MNKNEYTYIKKEIVQNNIGNKRYNVFTDKDGKRISIKHNRLFKSYIDYIDNLNYNEKYHLFLYHGACFGIMTNDVFLFVWASRIILERNNTYYEINKSEMKKELTYNQIRNYCIKFLKKVQ